MLPTKTTKNDSWFIFLHKVQINDEMFLNITAIYKTSQFCLYIDDDDDDDDNMF